MPKTTTIPIAQNFKVASAFWSSMKGAVWQALQVGGADYTAGTEGATLKSLTVNNSDTTAAPSFLFGLLDPSTPVVAINAIVAVGTVSATGVSTINAAPLAAIVDTSPLGKYMLLREDAGNGALDPGTFINAIGSVNTLTLSRATVGAVSPAANTVKAIPWQIIGSVLAPLGSGAASGGATANIDLLGSSVVTGLSFDSVGKPVLFIPSGYKVIVAALVAPTAPAAATGFFSVTGQIEEF